jgi:hypothetical protein
MVLLFYNEGEPFLGCGLIKVVVDGEGCWNSFLRRLLGIPGTKDNFLPNLTIGLRTEIARHHDVPYTMLEDMQVNIKVEMFSIHLAISRINTKARTIDPFLVEIYGHAS